MDKMKQYFDAVIAHPRSTAAGVGALLWLLGLHPPGWSEEKLAIAIVAIGQIFSADARDRQS